MAGRPPTPSAINELRGTYKKNPQRRRPDEPDLEAGDIDCPDWLSAGAKAEWARVYPILSRAGVMSPAYLAALTGYCLYFAEREEAARMVVEFGTIVDDDGVKVKSPYIAVRDAANDRCKIWACELGLTAASKTKAAKIGNSEKKQNRFAKFAVHEITPAG
jgi:P27 family predicted phage terminase small subunit